MNSLELVRVFHETYGQPINDEPSLNDEAVNKLRVELLKEEVLELQIALEDKDPVAVLDALTDIQYVLDGAYLSLGFHSFKDRALKEVQRSNLSKLGEDGLPIKRLDGKVLKGKNYSPPDLKSILWVPKAGDRVTIDHPIIAAGVIGVVTNYPCWHDGVDVLIEGSTRPLIFSIDEVRKIP